MDRKMTVRIERIGTTLAQPPIVTVALLQAYLQDFHPAAWELAMLDRGSRGQGDNLSIDTQAMLRAYGAWLVRYDAAWKLSQAVAALPPPPDWAAWSAHLGKSPDTCRQVYQALERGKRSEAKSLSS